MRRCLPADAMGLLPVQVKLLCLTSMHSAHLSPALCDADCQRHVAADCDQHYACHPGLHLGGQVAAGDHDVNHLRHHVEQDDVDDVLYAAGSPVQDPHDLAGLAVHMEVQVQGQKVAKHRTAE
eukprot:GHRQ01038940.1.p2 GENE.GHRQ01038940.1~~GHRQ01038940.1.p2  ORF type:complete len:123 (-),score=18.26 GHRQ01038940.1:241-609(-)